MIGASFCDKYCLTVGFQIFRRRAIILLPSEINQTNVEKKITVKHRKKPHTKIPQAKASLLSRRPGNAFLD